MLSGSPHGSVMSCQSLAARAFAEPDHDSTHLAALHRSVRFSSESRASSHGRHDPDSKRETPGSISLTALSPLGGHGSPMSQSAPSAAGCFGADTGSPSSCRFPKLEECAHFHYERVALGGLAIQAAPCDDEGADADEGWVYLHVRSHVAGEGGAGAGEEEGGEGSSAVCSWRLTRSRDNFLQLDDMLHRCIYERKVSGLPNLREQLPPPRSREGYERLLADYVHHLSIIADDSINCGPVLNWLQMDNKGHKLLVANEDSSSINTPAVAAAYSVRKYVSQARDEISFEVGDMISIIDMPGPQESLWWRGKRGFRVGFFPHHCVAVIGDKVPRHMTQPPPIVGSVAVAPMKPVLRKHGKLISLFRSFILSRPSRRSLKAQGILRERVFGCDLGEHLLNCGRQVPQLLQACAAAIEARGAVDGVYRLSGGSGLTQRLRAAFDAGQPPDLAGPDVQRDPHAVPSLLKMYFRELPNPLCTYQLYDSFVAAVQLPDEAGRLRAVRDAAVKLPPPHYRTLAFLMRHLRRVSLLASLTGMTARNTAIVWAPNLLRAPRPQHALQGVAVQAVVTEFLICYAEELFSQDQGADSGPQSLEQERCESIGDVELRGVESCRRPKSLPANPPTKLLSLEEARRRGGGGSSLANANPAPPGPPAPAGAPTDDVQLRPSSHLRPKYIEVGSGPNNLPQYHTVLDLPISGGKRALKRSPSGWRGLFARHKVRAGPPLRPPLRPPSAPPQPCARALDEPDAHKEAAPGALRPAKSCESLASDCDTLPPLAVLAPAPLKHHTRSSSCDSYFEPWQAELAHMRLRLSPQERDHHMFSEEDEPAPSRHQQCSSPGGSLGSSSSTSTSSPRRALHDHEHDASELAQRRLAALEAQVSQLRYIDGESPRLGLWGAAGAGATGAGATGAGPPGVGAPPEKRHSARTASPPHADVAKRICKDRDSPMTSLSDFSAALGSVKLRERQSPRKSKASRHSGAHSLTTHDRQARVSWHGQKDGQRDGQADGQAGGQADGHSTLIRVDWPRDASSANLTAGSSPGTPLTPHYDPLDSDSELSDSNKRTIRVTGDLHPEPPDYENLDLFAEERRSGLSAVSDSSKHDLRVMTSSHDSSSSHSSLPKGDELYECFGYRRPAYINLQSSSTSKSSPGSPLRSPLKSTISITFRSPTRGGGFEDTPTNDRDSVYEDIDLEKNLSIVEEASVPHTDASLPTQQACQPEDLQDLIILETPTDHSDVDVYSQVKFFKKSIEEVNAMLLPEDGYYENMAFEKRNEYENVELDSADRRLVISEDTGNVDNGNLVKGANVRELAIRFESPTEQKPQFTFEKFKAEVKYPTLERKEDSLPKSPKDFNLSRSSSNARSLDENAFIKEFGSETSTRRKSMEVRDKKPPDLNLNTDDQEHKVLITPTTENKISLIQRFDKSDVKSLITVETDKQLSRERIEKYKEERRNFLREKYSSQSFRSNPEQLTRIKIRKGKEDKVESSEAEPKFERRNTVDLGQRMRFSLAKSAQELETIQSPSTPEREFAGEARPREYDRKEKCSPSYNIRDMAAMFEQKSQPNSG